MNFLMATKTKTRKRGWSRFEIKDFHLEESSKEILLKVSSLRMMEEN